MSEILKGNDYKYMDCGSDILGVMCQGCGKLMCACCPCEWCEALEEYNRQCEMDEVMCD